MQETHGKFNNLDRDRVIDAIQKRDGVKLRRVGRRHKLRRDASGKNWWVLGGLDTWHGIPEKMMEDERRARVGGVLVIAHKKPTSIDVFKGPLAGLVSASGKLPRASQPPREYKFNVKVQGARMWCKEVPSVVLDRVFTIPYSEQDKERDRGRYEVQETVATISPEDRAELMDKPQQMANGVPQVPAQIEGLSGEVKENHCSQRAKYFSLSKAQIQSWITAMIQKIKQIFSSP